MDKETRDYLKRQVDKEARSRKRGSFSPDDLTIAANDADKEGYHEIAQSLRNIRDKVVNPLMGEGWTVERIEDALERYFK